MTEGLERAIKEYFNRSVSEHQEGYEAALSYAISMCIEMAERYDHDIEGCDGEQLVRYSEGIECCHRLADWLYSRRPLEPLGEPYPKRYVPKKVSIKTTKKWLAVGPVVPELDADGWQLYKDGQWVANFGRNKELVGKIADWLNSSERSTVG